MSIARIFLSQPHAILSITLLAIILGILGYQNIPINLFPNTNRPMVSVVVQWPGATTTDVATDVTHALEIRLSAIDGVRRVTSTSRDQVSAVQVEFEYDNDINTAANAVTTELSRVSLPAGTLQPLVFKITDAAHPVMVLAVTPAKDSELDLAQVRRIAEHDLRDTLLNLPGVAEVEIFGGPIRQVAIDLDRDKLLAHGLNISQVVAALIGSNLSHPAGLIHRQGNRFLLTAQTLAKSPEDLAAVLVPLPNGEYLRIGDLGKVAWGVADANSIYRGNGKAAVGVALLRSERGFAQPVIDTINSQFNQIRTQFPNLNLEIADTQGRLIELTVDNMLDSLRDAVIMTILVIFLFLGNTRAAFVVGLSLPITYLLSFAILWWLGYEFDMVTLSAIIIAVGLLADDAIVVIENIERRMRELKEDGITAATRGLDEIFLADVSGTVSTILVLIPIMFIGGYVQTVLRPLTVTLTVSLASSLIVSITLIPLLAPIFLKPDAPDPLAWILKPFTRFFLHPLQNIYVALVKWGLENRAIVLLLFVIVFIGSASQMRMLGRELMPMMDTGIISIRFEAEADTDDDRMEKLAEQVEQAIRDEVPKDSILSISTVIGSEAGVKSFGAERLLQQGEITLNLIDRFHRIRTIYNIEDGIRTRLHQIPGLISANVTEFASTPLSSIRASVDVMISGPDPAVLDRLADEVIDKLAIIKGLTGFERSWQGKSERIELNVNPKLARLQGLSAEEIAQQVAIAVGGIQAGGLRVLGQTQIPIWVRLRAEQRANQEDLAALNIRAPDGHIIPLASVATPRIITAPTAETHQYLEPTIDILAWRRNLPITRLHEQVSEALEDLVLPRGYKIQYEGEYKQLSESFGRLIASFSLGLILLYFMLSITFRSFLDPIAIFACLPLALIGAAWGLLLADKVGSMPAFMGYC